MAKLASIFPFLFFFFLLTLCSSGTHVGFSYNARGSIATSSLSRTLSFLELNKVSGSRIRAFVVEYRVLSKFSNSGVSVDLYLDENLVDIITNSKPTAVLWLKTHVVTFMPRVNIKSITLRGSNDFSKLLSSLRLIHSVVNSFKLKDEVKVSVAFSLEFLENLNRTQENDLHRVLGFIKKIKSFVIVEGSTNDYGLDAFLKSMIQKAMLASSILSSDPVDIVLTVKSLLDLSEKDIMEFEAKFSKSLENSQISDKIAELYVEVSSMENLPSFRRKLLKNLKTISHDTVAPPVTFPSDNPTPTIVTVPATNPVTVTPANPASTPVPIPFTTPVMVPPTSPSVDPPAPITNPVTTPAPVTVPGGQPITNPVTTYPAPPGNVPVTTPVTNPVAPPATTNAPAIPGQSWCVAKNGASESALQAALDYACGMGGADCSQIQQGGSCYMPNTLQNHASFAFNSYYQKNPVATSCDFGGTGNVISTNPSTGSCVFPSSSSSSTPSSSSSSPPTTTALPPPSTTAFPPPTTTNPATTPSTPGNGAPGTVTPPSVLNSSSPGLGVPADFGSYAPPGVTTSSSKTATLQPSIGCIAMTTFFFARMFILHM